MAHHFVVARLNQGFHRTPFAKNLIDVFLNSNIMQLPGINVIGIQQLERHVEVFKRGIAGSLFGLSRDKNMVPAALKTLSKITFTPPLRSTVNGGGIEIIHSQIK